MCVDAWPETLVVVENHHAPTPQYVIASTTRRPRNHDSFLVPSAA